MYLIDGHNLIGTNMLGFGLDDPKDEDKLVQRLIGFANGQQKKLTIIFDGGVTASRKSHTSLVEVRFTSRPTIADDVLKWTIGATRDVSRWTVVSSDRAVMTAAQQRGMKTMSSQAFARKLQERQTALNADEEDIGSRERPVMSPQELEEYQKLFSDPPKKSRR